MYVCMHVCMYVPNILVYINERVRSHITKILLTTTSVIKRACVLVSALAPDQFLNGIHSYCHAFHEDTSGPK